MILRIIFRIYCLIDINFVLINLIGSIFPAIFLVAASYGAYNKPLVIFLFTVVMGFLGCFFSGVKVNALDLSPNYSGSLMVLSHFYLIIILQKKRRPMKVNWWNSLLFLGGHKWFGRYGGCGRTANNRRIDTTGEIIFLKRIFILKIR